MIYYSYSHLLQYLYIRCAVAAYKRMSVIIKPIVANIQVDKNGQNNSGVDAVCQIGGQQKRSKSINQDKQNPKWSDTFIFYTNCPLLRVRVQDNDQIGAGTVDLKDLFMKPNQTKTQYIDLNNKGKRAGRIQLSMQYQGPPIQEQDSIKDSCNKGWGKHG